IALAALVFALGIAAGNGPRLTSAARDAAMDWSPRRAPEPLNRLKTEGTTIMSADTTPGYQPDDNDPTDPGAEVVDLDAARPAPRPAPPSPARDDAREDPEGEGPADDGPADDDDADAESVLVGQVVDGPAVDPPDEPQSLRPRGGRDRRPVIPPGLASRAAVA